MSSGSIGSSDEPSELTRAIQLLKEAQAIMDRLNRPEVGARLQDVIDLLGSFGTDESLG